MPVVELARCVRVSTFNSASREAAALARVQNQSCVNIAHFARGIAAEGEPSLGAETVEEGVVARARECHRVPGRCAQVLEAYPADARMAHRVHKLTAIVVLLRRERGSARHFRAGGWMLGHVAGGQFLVVGGGRRTRGGVPKFR